MPGSDKRQIWVVRACFGVLLLLGLLLFQDYGVSLDEPTDHQNGAVSGQYVAQRLLPARLQPAADGAQVGPLANYHDNDHGVLFELPVAALGRLLAHGEPARYYLLRHLLIFSTFVLGVWALYRLARLRLGSRWAGLLAAGLLVLSPRMFGEAFYNGKDIVFMALFTLAVLTLARLMQRPTPGRALLHALATAAALDVRLPAVVLLAFTAAMLGLLAFQPFEKRRLTGKNALQLGLLYGLSTGVFVVMGWPYLWENPVGNFVAAYRSLSHYNWPNTNLYFGRFVWADALPWHYVPVWLGITTPLPYLLLGLAGLAATGGQFVRRPGHFLGSFETRLDLLTLGWLLVPIGLVIGLHSTLYDGWRHLYFVYPALLLLATQVLWALGGRVRQRRSGWRVAAVALVAVATETGRTAVQMVRLHPYQAMYFSFLPPQVVERQFERDYWGLAYRAGLEWILAHDAAPRIIIASDLPDPLYANSLLLPTTERARLHYVGSRPARYFITNYRWHPQPYPASRGREVYTVRAGGVKILSVFERP